MAIEKQTLTQDQWLKLLFTIFLAGSAWARFEYKMDKVSDDLHASFEKYIIQNEADKLMINYKQLKFEEAIQAKLVLINEYIKPNEPRLKRRK